MNKKIITIIIAVVLFFVVSLGALGYFVYTKIGSTFNKVKDMAEQQGIETFTGNISDLITKNASLKCEYSFTEAGVSMTGTTYLANQMVRGEFVSQPSEGEQIKSNVLIDKEYMYMWADNMPQAIKMKLSDIQATDQVLNEENTEQPENNLPFNFNALNNLGSFNPLGDAYEFKCAPWALDSSKFIVPENIEFVDWSETMKMMQDIVPTNIQVSQDTDTGTNGDEMMDSEIEPNSLCSACEYIQDEAAKLQCKTSLSCN